MNRPEILQRIKACFNLGSKEANTTEHEMATAVAMAKKLMAKYNIAEAEVLSTQVEGTAEPAIEEVTVETRLNPHSYENNLAMVCKDLFSVHPLLCGKTIGGKYRRVIKFFGLPTDIELAAAAFKVLRDEINKMAMDCEFQGTERDQWRIGVVHTLRVRAKDMASGLTKEEESKCRDLVVTKNQLIAKHIQATVGEVKPGRSYVPNNQAYTQGKHDGYRVNLGFRNQIQ